MKKQKRKLAKSECAVYALELFNEKAIKLEGLSFTKTVFNQKSGFRIYGEEGQFIKAERFGPDDESIDAFLFTLRFFVQDNETTSFRNMADIYDKLSVSADLVQKFNEARNKTNEFLDKPAPIKIGKANINYRHVFEVFLYGGLAHANKEKKAVYDSWLANPVLFPVLENEFVYAIATYLQAIFYIREVNKEALTQIKPGV